MSSIRCHGLSGEIEIQGSEAFIESNFYLIQGLLSGSPEERDKTQLRAITHKGDFANSTIPARGLDFSLNSSPEPDESPLLDIAAPAPTDQVASPVLVNRPPQKKYIRKVGLPGQEKIAIEIVQQQPKVLSLDELKEKFGLSQFKERKTGFASRRDDVLSGGW